MCFILSEKFVFLSFLNLSCLVLNLRPIIFLSLIKAKIFAGDPSTLTFESLQNLNKFSLENVEFTCFPPPGIKQVRVQDGTRVKWRLPPVDIDEKVQSFIHFHLRLEIAFLITFQIFNFCIFINL
jgi:hypothetical protein